MMLIVKELLSLYVICHYVAEFTALCVYVCVIPLDE